MLTELWGINSVASWIPRSPHGQGCVDQSSPGDLKSRCNLHWVFVSFCLNTSCDGEPDFLEGSLFCYWIAPTLNTHWHRKSVIEIHLQGNSKLDYSFWKLSRRVSPLPSLDVWPWACHWTSLRFSFFTCKRTSLASYWPLLLWHIIQLQ